MDENEVARYGYSAPEDAQTPPRRTPQTLAESGVLGALGGLIGTSLGVVTVVGVAVARDWTPVVHPATASAAPVVGLITGVLAGLYPAWRASRIEPAEALRH